MSATPAATLALSDRLRDLRAAATWDEGKPDALALIDPIELAMAAAALCNWADTNSHHTGAAAARALADLVAQVGAQDLPLFDVSRDVRDAVRAAARIVQLAGRVPATNDAPRSMVATITNHRIPSTAARR